MDNTRVLEPDTLEWNAAVVNVTCSLCFSARTFQNACCIMLLCYCSHSFGRNLLPHLNVCLCSCHHFDH